MAYKQTAPNYDRIIAALDSRRDDPGRDLERRRAARGRSSGGGRVRPRAGRSTELASVAYDRTHKKKKSEDDGFGLDDIGNVVSSALQVVDAPRSAIQSSISDIATSLGKGDYGEALLNATALPVTLAPRAILGAADSAGLDVKGATEALYANNRAARDLREHTGAGTYLERGLREAGIHDTWLNNQWVKRGLGFTGDVATDPLTYLGGASVLEHGTEAAATAITREGGEKVATQFAKEAGVSTADRIAMKSLREEGQQVANRAAQKVVEGKGLSALSADELELYFGSRGGLKMRVPGTGRVLNRRGSPTELSLLPKSATDPITSAGRAVKRGLTENKVSRALSEKLGGANPELDAMLRSGDPDKIARALDMKAVIKTANAKREAGLRLLPDAVIDGEPVGANGLGERAMDVYTKKIHKIAKKDPEAIIHAIETGDASAIEGGQAVKDFLHELHRVAYTSGMTVEERANYFPRWLSDEAKAAESGSAGTAGEFGKATLEKGRINEEIAAAHEARTGEALDPTNEWSIRQAVEDWKKQEFPDLPANYYETNIDKILPHYVEAMGSRLRTQEIVNRLEGMGHVVPAWIRKSGITKEAAEQAEVAIKAAEAARAEGHTAEDAAKEAAATAKLNKILADEGKAEAQRAARQESEQAFADMGGLGGINVSGASDEIDWSDPAAIEAALKNSEVADEAMAQQDEIARLAALDAAEAKGQVVNPAAAEAAARQALPPEVMAAAEKAALATGPKRADAIDELNAVLERHGLTHDDAMNALAERNIDEAAGAETRPVRSTEELFGQLDELRASGDGNAFNSLSEEEIQGFRSAFADAYSRKFEEGGVKRTAGGRLSNAERVRREAAKLRRGFHDLDIALEDLNMPSLRKQRVKRALNTVKGDSADAIKDLKARAANEMTDVVDPETQKWAQDLLAGVEPQAADQAGVAARDEIRNAAVEQLQAPKQFGPRRLNSEVDAYAADAEARIAELDTQDGVEYVDERIRQSNRQASSRNKALKGYKGKAREQYIAEQLQGNPTLRFNEETKRFESIGSRARGARNELTASREDLEAFLHADAQRAKIIQSRRAARETTMPGEVRLWRGEGTPEQEGGNAWSRTPAGAAAHAGPNGKVYSVTVPKEVADAGERAAREAGHFGGAGSAVYLDPQYREAAVEALDVPLPKAHDVTEAVPEGGDLQSMVDEMFGGGKQADEIGGPDYSREAEHQAQYEADAASHEHIVRETTAVKNNLETRRLAIEGAIESGHLTDEQAAHAIANLTADVASAVERAREGIAPLRHASAMSGGDVVDVSTKVAKDAATDNALGALYRSQRTPEAQAIADEATGVYSREDAALAQYERDAQAGIEGAPENGYINDGSPHIGEAQAETLHENPGQPEPPGYIQDAYNREAAAQAQYEADAAAGIAGGGGQIPPSQPPVPGATPPPHPDEVAAAATSADMDRRSFEAGLADAKAKLQKAQERGWDTTYHERRLAIYEQALQETDAHTARALQFQADALDYMDQADNMAKNARELDAAAARLNTPKGQWALRNEIDKSMARLRVDNSLAAPNDIADILNRVSQVNTPEGMKKFLHHYDKALNYIKAWQLASPGFHVRNFMGGMFNNYLAGVELNAYSRFIRDRHAFLNGTLTEGPRAEAMRQLLPHVGSAQYSAFEVGGLEQITNAQRINPLSKNNLWLTSNRKVGGKVEEILRGALGYDRLLKGRSIDDAVSDIMKYHFDYQDLSRFERGTVKRVIPFYTWTRHNLPLQMEMYLRQPGKYARYWQAKQEIEMGTHPEGVVPSYFLNEGFGIHTPFNFGGGDVYITPDLPFTTTVAQGLPDLSGVDPSRPGTYASALDGYASMATPLLKTPIERTMNRQFFKGIPFQDKKYDAPTLWKDAPGLNEALRAIGIIDGKGQVTDRDMYTVEQYLPMLGRMRRLGGGSKKDNERQLTSWLSFLGVPLKTNTKYEQQLEQFRRNIQKGNVTPNPYKKKY